MPQGSTPADVQKVYELAYELGAKGISVYVDNSRPDQVLTVIKEEAEEMCPVCLTGENLSKQENCTSCTCGFSKCSF